MWINLSFFPITLNHTWTDGCLKCRRSEGRSNQMSFNKKNGVAIATANITNKEPHYECNKPAENPITEMWKGHGGISWEEKAKTRDWWTSESSQRRRKSISGDGSQSQHHRAKNKTKQVFKVKHEVKSVVVKKRAQGLQESRTETRRTKKNAGKKNNISTKLNQYQLFGLVFLSLSLT